MTFNLENQIRTKEDIMIFENFITAEQCNSIIKYWDVAVEKGYLIWDPISFYDSFASNVPDTAEKEDFGLHTDFFIELKNKIKDAVEICRGDKVREVSYHCQKWVEGAYAGYHSDNTPIDSPEFNSFERSKWAAFLYLNDDFEGGVLNFRDHEISITPKVGMLVAFAGGHHNIHEVQMITKGLRLTIGSFWDNAEVVYSKEKQDFWEKDIAEQRKQQADDAELWAKMKERGERMKPGPDQTAKKDVALGVK
jgi:hypothetical protein